MRAGLFIRRGKLIGRENFVLEGIEPDTNGEMMSAFVKQFYDEAAFVPPSIVLQKDLDERSIIEQWLRSRRSGQKVVLTVPTEGPKFDLLQLATENAAATLTSLQAQWQADTNRQTEALAQIQEALGLSDPPGRIECFDISTLQGTHTVGSMVVFAKGAPDKGDYRRFNIKGHGSQGEPMTSRRCVRCCAAASAARLRKLWPILGGWLANLTSRGKGCPIC